jgi:hypothetical protein
MGVFDPGLRLLWQPYPGLLSFGPSGAFRMQRLARKYIRAMYPFDNTEKILSMGRVTPIRVTKIKNGQQNRPDRAH